MWRAFGRIYTPETQNSRAHFTQIYSIPDNFNNFLQAYDESFHFHFKMETANGYLWKKLNFSTDATFDPLTGTVARDFHSLFFIINIIWAPGNWLMSWIKLKLGFKFAEISEFEIKLNNKALGVLFIHDCFGLMVSLKTLTSCKNFSESFVRSSTTDGPWDPLQN